MKLQQKILWRKCIFPDLIYKDGLLILMFPALKYIFGIWSEVWLNPFGSCNPNLVSSDEFEGCIFPTVKSIFFGNISLLKSNFYFQGTVIYVQYGLYI
jgi:hypothetical protein